MSTNIYTTAPGYGAIPPSYGNVFVSTGTGSSVWKNTTGTSYTIPVSGTGSNPIVSIGADGTKTSLKVAGNAEILGDTKISGNLTVDGVNIGELLAGIQSQLGLLIPNPQIEEEFDQLRKLGDQYRKLETLIKEQKRIWDILKKE
jgi:hypothetical protein